MDADLSPQLGIRGHSLSSKGGFHSILIPPGLSHTQAFPYLGVSGLSVSPTLT